MILTKKSRRFFYTLFWEVVILEIYLDVVFLENFLLDYMLLLLTGKMMKKDSRRLGMIIGALLGSMYSVFYCLMLAENAPNRNGFMVGMEVLNVFVLMLMIRLSYKKLSMTENMWLIVPCFGFAFAMEGILSWIDRLIPQDKSYRYATLTLLGSVWFGYMFIKGGISGICERWFHKKTKYPVCIRIEEKEIRCQGLMDSGNSLYEPITKRPVVIVEADLLREHHVGMSEKGFFMIPYHAIGTEKGMLKGVLADELDISTKQEEKRWQKVMLGIYEGKLTQRDEYQVILHPRL